MSDETPTAPVEEQDKPQAPEETSPEPSDTGTSPETVDVFDEKFDPSTLDEALQPAYQSLRGDYTRKTQELAEQRRRFESEIALVEKLRSDKDTQEEIFRQLAEALGYEVGEAEQEALAPEEELSRRIERLERERETDRERVEREQAQSQEFEFIDSELTQIEESVGRKFTQDEVGLLASAAMARRDSSGYPNVREAFEAYSRASAAQKKAWLDSKNAPQAPSPGTAATDAPDLNDDQQRRRLMAQIIEGGAE